MEFGHLELGVRDPVATRDFYVQRLGFALVADQGPEFQWVKRGGLEILLRRGTPSPGLSIVYYVEDPAVEGLRLRANGVDATMQGQCLRVHDPDGHLIQIVNPEGDHSER